MQSARRILIETDVHEIVSVRIGRNLAHRFYCEACGVDEEMIDLNAAVTASGISATELINRIGAGLIHSPVSPTGHLLICLGSLKQQADVTNRNYEIAID
jgi:hypothetical protein